MQQLPALPRFNQRMLSPDATLAAPPGALAGVPTGATEALAACAIETAGGLAQSALFANCHQDPGHTYCGCLQARDDAGWRPVENVTDRVKFPRSPDSANPVNLSVASTEKLDPDPFFIKAGRRWPERSSRLGRCLSPCAGAELRGCRSSCWPGVTDTYRSAAFA